MPANRKTNLVIAVLLLIALASGGWLLTYYLSLQNADAEFDHLAQSLIDQSTEAGPNLFDFTELQSQNSDIVGWLTIDGTKIDYPVMYTPGDPEYYLHKNFQRQYSVAGVPFIDGRCSLSPRSDNLMIHAHNMKDGSMFAGLLLYEDEAFWLDHPEILFHTPEETKVYHLVAAFRAELYQPGQDFKYYTFINAASESEFDAYISGAKNASIYDTGIIARYGDQLLTLSTCAYHADNGRFVVLARAKP